MAQHHSQIIFWVPWFVLVGISISLIVQGWMILNEKHGYQENPRFKKHPEITEIKGDTVVLMAVKFTDQDLEGLQQRVLQQKMDELFEEPSTYEDDEDDDGMARTH